jgi:exonuclease SbcD
MKPDLAGCFSSDWHIDATRNLEDTAKCVDFVIAETIRRADALGPKVPFCFTHGGDGYRSSHPLPIETDIMHRVRLLRRHGIESEIIVANHDIRESEAGGSVHAFVDMRNLGNAMDVIEEPTVRPVMCGDQTIAYRLLIPHIGKALLQRSGLNYRTYFKQVMNDLISRCPAGSRMILVSHFLVKEAKVGTNEYVVGDDQNIPLGDLVDPRLLAVFLGDVHRAQKMCDKPWVGYCGSIDRVDFGEAEDSKGFIFYEVYGSEIKIEFVPTPARRFLHIVADLSPNQSEGSRFSDVPEKPSDIQPWLEAKLRDYDLKNSIVKVTIKCGSGQKVGVDDRRLGDLLVKLGAERVRTVSFDMCEAKLQRAPEITEALSPVAALEKWVGTQDYSSAVKEQVVVAGKKLIAGGE